MGFLIRQLAGTLTQAIVIHLKTSPPGPKRNSKGSSCTCTLVCRGNRLGCSRTRFDLACRHGTHGQNEIAWPTNLNEGFTKNNCTLPNKPQICHIFNQQWPWFHWEQTLRYQQAPNNSTLLWQNMLFFSIFLMELPSQTSTNEASQSWKSTRTLQKQHMHMPPRHMKSSGYSIENRLGKSRAITTAQGCHLTMSLLIRRWTPACKRYIPSKYSIATPKIILCQTIRIKVGKSTPPQRCHSHYVMTDDKWNSSKQRTQVIHISHCYLKTYKLKLNEMWTMSQVRPLCSPAAERMTLPGKRIQLISYLHPKKASDMVKCTSITPIIT